MNKKFQFASTAVVLALGLMAQAHAQTAGSVASGGSGALQWTAQNMLTGAATGGTGTNAVAGNPIYLPSFPASSGVVGMLMNTTAGGFVCSGTLLPDRQSILTAAHCVSDGAGTPNPISTTVFFQPPAGLSPTASIYSGGSGATAIQVTQYFVNANYTGEVIDQNDIAVLRLAAPAPAWAIAHNIYTGELTGEDFTVAGYGLRGTGTGTAGGGSTGRLRTGDNMYDYAWGNAAFGGFFTTRDVGGEFDGQNFFGFAEVEFSYVSDFDNGLAANDAANLISGAVGGGAGFANLGRGDREVGVAGGDSGGPNFINGLISGVNSYGLSFGAGFGDTFGGLNSSFGEFSGYVPTYIHADFINAALVPEPGTYLLMALGLAGVAGVARRRKAV